MCSLLSLSCCPQWHPPTRAPPSSISPVTSHFPRVQVGLAVKTVLDNVDEGGDWGEDGVHLPGGGGE